MQRKPQIYMISVYYRHPDVVTYALNVHYIAATSSVEAEATFVELHPDLLNGRAFVTTDALYDDHPQPVRIFVNGVRANETEITKHDRDRWIMSACAPYHDRDADEQHAAYWREITRAPFAETARKNFKAAWRDARRVAAHHKYIRLGMHAGAAPDVDFANPLFIEADRCLMRRNAFNQLH